MHRKPVKHRWLTPLERNILIGRAMEMRASGMQVIEIAAALGIGRRTATYWTNLESREKSKARAVQQNQRSAERRELARNPPKSEPTPPLPVSPPDTRGLTARICGDPIPSRSALALRGTS